MMKQFILAITFIVVLVAAAVMLVNPARSEPDQFIISNADAVAYVNTLESLELNALVAGVGPRVVVEYANSSKYFGMKPITIELQDLIDQVGYRFVIQYANANKYFSFSYPVELIGDNVPPQISGLFANGNGLVQWNTDEYANGEVRYSTQPGTYPYAISDPLFYKIHQIKLTGLMPGITYYYIVSSADRSGNTAETIEHSFMASQAIFLPLIQR